MASISTGLVQLHSRYYGKGPTKAKTHLVDDTVICILRGGFTRAERTLIEQGESDAVHHVRRSFQRVMEEQFRDIVESATGRNVIAYMSQVHEGPELALEVFVLEPEQDGEQEHREPSLAEPDVPAIAPDVPAIEPD
jgi:uncharacterized protein YbcI